MTYSKAILLSRLRKALDDARRTSENEAALDRALLPPARIATADMILLSRRIEKLESSRET